MTKHAATSPWKDQFNQPLPDDLRALVTGDAKKAFDRARSRLHALGELSEDVQWFGDCWYWSLAFMREGSDEPLALLIPSPEDFQMAAPLDHDFLSQLSIRRLKRFVRDGLELAMPPHNTRWAFWSTPTTGAVEDVMPVLKNKYAWLSSPPD